ncbi:Response regulator receiver domain-containing protein [Pricia antarctica]|uniref:Response regulator receiver domain-containing protein n=1 Tax=Pricia antarctica TaxID=641691 RepID=A0A1G6Y8C3_9FLAO|nr:response regulator [Pricia antarctica]SDD85967.1 Response regulator receiver domain-containing protein [Pricia antarctica]
MDDKVPIYDTVFMVDDDPIVNFVHQKIIGNIGIVNEIRSFIDPRKALAELRSELCHAGKSILVFLDLNMPKMSGFEFLEFMELEDFSLNVDVIVVTSSICENDRLLAELHPRFLRDFVTKPLKAEDLKKIVAYP